MTTDLGHIHLGLIGIGNMGGALLRGLMSRGWLQPDQVLVCDLDPERLAAATEPHAVAGSTDSKALADFANVLVLAVKPQVLPRVLAQLAPNLRPSTLLISIAAGVTCRSIESLVPDSVRVLRAMPNTPATVLAGVTALSPGARSLPEDLLIAERLFSAVGSVVDIEESLLDAVTGLSGSGPAYVLLAIEALSDGGVRMGLPRAVALKLAAETVFGTARMVLETNEHPARLRDAVTSPGGTTIAGLAALEEGAVRHAFINAVRAATLRATELAAASAKKL